MHYRTHRIALLVCGLSGCQDRDSTPGADHSDSDAAAPVESVSSGTMGDAGPGVITNAPSVGAEASSPAPTPSVDDQSPTQAPPGASQEPPTVSALACGDGVIDDGERCDDGNESDGDGCSSLCRVERGYDCSDWEPSECISLCGNGVVNPGEVCDDGNTNEELACAYGTDTCVSCNATCSAVLELTGGVCGDGVVSHAETCDIAANWCTACQVRPAIASGLFHTCALSSSGNVSCWGEGGNGQLGNGDTANQNTPVNVVNTNGGPITGVVAVSAGTYHTCALLSTGGVSCWGLGTNGDGDLVSQPTAVSMLDSSGSSMTGVASIAAGGSRTCALLGTGGVECWDIVYDAPVASSSTLTPIWGVTAVSSGLGHTCALLDSHNVVCWGLGAFGQLGNGLLDDQNTPVNVMERSGNLARVASLSAGYDHTCALLGVGSVKCWGFGGYGRLGNGVVDTAEEPLPVDVVDVNGSPLTGVASVSAGREHTCALLDNGTVNCWGYARYGQLGNGDTVDMATSTIVVDSLGRPLTGVLAVSAGGAHTCALLDTGGITCWGYGAFGQLGNGSNTDQVSPVMVESP